MRRASEFSMILEKLSLSTRTSAALVVTFALRIFRANIAQRRLPIRLGPGARGQQQHHELGSADVHGSLSLFCGRDGDCDGTQVQVTHQSNQGEVRVARALLSRKKKEVRVERPTGIHGRNVR